MTDDRVFTDRLSFCFNFSLYHRNLTHSERIYMSSISRFFFHFLTKSFTESIRILIHVSSVLIYSRVEVFMTVLKSPVIKGQLGYI